MSQTISGVSEFDPRPSPHGFYSLKVAGTYYGVGKVNPGIAKGDYVTFTAKQNAKGYWEADPKTIVKGSGTPVATAGGAVAPSAVAYSNREEGKQKSISWQAARNSAIEFMKLLRDQGALPKPGAKAADNFEVYSAILNEMTREFYDQSQNPEGMLDKQPGEAEPAPRRAPVDKSGAAAGEADAGWEGN